MMRLRRCDDDHCFSLSMGTTPLWSHPRPCRMVETEMIQLIVDHPIMSVFLTIVVWGLRVDVLGGITNIVKAWRKP